ncbi:Acyl-CoA N-acyltransferase [Penicillium hispanicum]|uniref:Acyl-CoA N-acyltransferase n=1 Tax=Penicillium hispanicum TaxID=1080232 RepID=UPI0025415912|nr:Acyl-CoA N-acyltransferase [Penicillium hispanicum]KAJ5593948.1 Acyl-CoA N-acyltransferase [Penicillium hispanicum]
MSQSTSTAPPYSLVGHADNSAFHLQSLSTELCLRIPSTDDIPALLDILGNKANSEFDKSVAESSIEELEGIARRWTTISQPPTHANFLIWHRETPVGIAGLGWIGPCNKDQDPSDASLAGAAGVMLQPVARGKGYAHEALRMVFSYGFRELQLVEIRVGSHSGNLPMKMVMERKFGLEPATSTGGDGVDEFGNDLLWIIRKGEWQDGQAI